MKRVILILVFALFYSVIVCDAEAQSKRKKTTRAKTQTQQQPATSHPTQSTNQPTRSENQSSKENTKQLPNIPKAPQPPSELALDVNKLVTNVGDKWSYLISSADESLDGKTFIINLKEKNSANYVFSVQLGDSELKTANIPKSEATWFMPIVTEKGDFTIKGIGGDYPVVVIRGKSWTTSASQTRYAIQYGSPVPIGTEILYVINASDPLICNMPVGTFNCVEITKRSPNIVTSQNYLSPDNSFAVQSRVRRPNKGALISFRLISFESSVRSENADNTKNSYVQILTTAERQKAIEWIKANSKFGEGSDIIDDVLFFVDSGVGLYPKAAVRIAVSSDLTKSGKGYILECRNSKFIAREMTAEESDKSGKGSITRSVVP